MKKHDSIDEKIENGYHLEAGEVIEYGFQLFKKTFLIAGIATIILSIFTIGVYFAIFAFAYGVSDLTESMIQLETLSKDISFIIGSNIVGALIATLFSPITAGFINLNHLAENNETLSISSIFSYFNSVYIKDLLIANFLIGLTITVVTSALAINGLDFLGSVFQGITNIITIFTIPLIIYGKQNYINAIGKSISLFIKNPVAIILALIVGGIGACVGILALCIGIFFTFPFIYSIHYALYKKGIGIDEKSDIEAIGKE